MTIKKAKPIPRSRLRQPFAPLPKEVPPSALEVRVRKLPMFGPGITITVALPLLPTYLELYDLVPMTRGEVRDFEKRTGIHKPDGVLWVKRVPKKKEEQKNV